MRRTARPQALAPGLAALGLAALALAGASGCRSAEAAREHERKGAMLLQQGRTAEALTSLEAALDEDPGSVQAAVSLAAIYERAGDPMRALQVLGDVVRERPTTGLPRMSLAGLLTRLGRLEEALGHYVLVGQMNKHAAAYLGMADIYEVRGETAAGERAIIAAIQAEPTNPTPRLRLARLYDGIGRPEARVAWERFLAAAVGNPDERPFVDEANARLKILAPALTTEEQAGILATVRRHLATIPVGPGGSLSPQEVAAVAADAGPAPLRRFYSGRMHLRLRSPGAPIVRGVGSGASLYEGAIAAAEDLRRSRVYDVYYAGALGRARAEVLLEIGDPEPFAVAELDAQADVVPAEGGPFDEDDLLEWRDGATTIAVLPTDRAAHGLGTLRETLAWAATEAGLAPGEWRRGSLRRVRVRGFIEDEAAGWAAAGARPGPEHGAGPAAAASGTRAASARDASNARDTSGAGGPTDSIAPKDSTRPKGARAGGASLGGDRDGKSARHEDEGPSVRGAAIGRAAPVDLEGGLPVPPPVDRMSALAAARAGALWMAGLIGTEGAIPSAYDPRAGTLAPASVPSQSAAVEALLQASQSTDEPRLQDAAALARRWLAVEILRSGSDEKTPGGGRADGPAAVTPTSGAAALAASIERAIADLDTLARVARPAVTPGASGAASGPSAVTTQKPAGASGSGQPGAQKPGASGPGGTPANTAQKPGAAGAAASSGAAAGAARAAAEQRLHEVVREALRLSIDPCASLLYTDRTRPLGAFREGRLDPRVTLEGTARLVAALCRAAPRLRSDAATPSKS